MTASPVHHLRSSTELVRRHRDSTTKRQYLGPCPLSELASNQVRRIRLNRSGLEALLSRAARARRLHPAQAMDQFWRDARRPRSVYVCRDASQSRRSPEEGDAPSIVQFRPSEDEDGWQGRDSCVGERRSPHGFVLQTTEGAEIVRTLHRKGRRYRIFTSSTEGHRRPVAIPRRLPVGLGANV